MGAKGAGNPIGFIGSLSDALYLIHVNKEAGGCKGATVLTQLSRQ